MVNVVFTGLYRHSPSITNMSLSDRIRKIRDNGVDKIYWYVWAGHSNDEVRKHGVEVIEIEEPYPHSRGITGRQRQIYNIESCFKDFSDDDILLKLRWDIDFNDALIQNVSSPEYFEPIDSGLIGHKIWTGFYNIQELFSPSDISFAGYKKDLDTLINHEYSIDGISANNYISHDGMMLMPRFIEKNKKLCDNIRLVEPDPWALMFKEEHVADEEYLSAWAFSYYIFYKYFKTGPLGSSYFKRGDQARWPFSIVDYNNFRHNYDTITGKAPKLGLYPRYRVYDDIFVQRVVGGEYRDDFGKAIHNLIKENRELWEGLGV
mgnify:FL=1